MHIIFNMFTNVRIVNSNKQLLKPWKYTVESAESIEKEHGQQEYLCHLKMDRNVSDVVDIKQYRSDKV